MSTRARLWLITTFTFFTFLVIALVVRTILGPVGGSSWMLVGGLTALGFVAAGVVHRFLAKRWKDRMRREKLSAREDQISQAFTAARKRLAASGRTESPRIGKLPLVLILGPQGATKTTVVVQSGLEPELLAGEVHQGDAVVPTENVNLWFAEGTVLLEAGGRLIDQEERWEAVLDHAQPDRLAAALGRRKQAPRVAVVCVGCDELLKPGASEAIPALARKIRERLAAAAQALGIQLPVYVLFTRADRLPYFDDYVRSLSREEARQGLGATLRVEDVSASGTYAETQAARVGAALEGILRNLALNRREVIQRESDAEVKAGAYEFPRELGKARGLIQRFLVELCRPSQLDASPFLRGFYFTGVRAVVVSDPGAAPAPAHPDAQAAPMGATAVFDPSKLQAAAQQAVPSSRSRRVPDWVFLEPVFREVILGDRSAQGITSGGVRIDFLRRTLLAVAMVVGLFASGAFVVSYLRNRAVARETVAAAEVARTAGEAAGPIPTLEDLQKLEELRVPADTLWRWEQEGPPWSYRWGLYAGDNLLPEALRVYLAAFERVLGRPARDALIAYLQGVRTDSAGASQYESVYRSLKAYLITTSHPQHSTPAFLPPELVAHWDGARSLDPERSALLGAQLDFFARVIPAGHPFAPAPQDALVARTRQFLGQFAEADRFYQSMLTEAAQWGEDVDFEKRYPDAVGVVRNRKVVPGQFTRPARARVLGTDVEEFFSTEDWVMGGAVVPPQDRQALERDLRSRYGREYIQQWEAFLDSGRVVPFGSTGDAANKLARLSAPQSPLLIMLDLASRNTAVEDSSDVDLAFRPLHAVSPAVDSVNSYIGPWNQGYVDALGSLGRTMSQAAGSGSSDLGQVVQAASQAEGAVSQLSQGFGIDPQGQAVRSAVTDLLRQPIRYAENLAHTQPRDALNGLGRDFCRTFQNLLSGFPFEPGAPLASVEDVAAALKPGESRLWTFYQDQLAQLMPQQGSRYEPRLGAEPPLNPAFVDFFNRAAQVSNGLFDASGAPSVQFTLTPEIPAGFDAITVNIDGRRKTFTRTDRASPAFVWEGERAEYARIIGEANGADVSLGLDVTGSPWAVFRLLQRADRIEPVGSGTFRVHWPLPGQQVTLTAELRLTTNVPILDPDYLAGVYRCVSRIAR